LHKFNTVELSSSTGLSSRTASALAYGGWWVTGLIVWFIERHDRVARFHAAQSVVAFGTIAFLVLSFGFLAAASLSFLPAAFTVLLGSAVFAWVVGVALWAVSLWRAANGVEWRIPFASDLADRMLRA
jgi:uncharacterized membrane protein